MGQMRRCGLFAFTFASLVAPREARAADDLPSVAICDVAAATPPVANFALVVASISLTTGPEGRSNGLIDSLGSALPYTLAFGGAVYLTCSPTLHAVNGRPLAALGSFAARIGGPLAGVAATYGTYRLTGGRSTASIAMTLTAVPMGMALAILTDYFFLTPPPAPTPRPTFAPVIRPGPDGATAGILGTF